MTTASRAWVKRNLGFDPIKTPAPPESFAIAAAAKPKAEPEDIQREIIDFDSEGAEGAALFAFSTATGSQLTSEQTLYLLRQLRQLRQRLVAPQRRQGHLRLERRRVVPCRPSRCTARARQ